MEIRDPVHGSIQIFDEEIPIIEHKFFQRLRNIKQLGLSEYAFPGATHTRYLHSIGVMHVGSKVFNRLFPEVNAQTKRLQISLRLACLLHDIGHAPLSHATEMVMPHLKKLQLPAHFTKLLPGNLDRQATHEDFTIKAIVDSSLRDAFTLVEKKYGVSPLAVAELILGQCHSPDYFIMDGVDYFPLLHQLVSSEMDCDRMDYLLRDTYFCGVSYGHFDLDWIIDNLTSCVEEGRAYLGISERAISTFDDFLMGRYHMFLMIYFHYRSVCLEKMLSYYFHETKAEYEIPADIESYQKHDDHYLWGVLRQSKNAWAQRIVKNSIPAKILETFGPRDLAKMDALEEHLKSTQIPYIRSSSSGRISKYYAAPAGGHHEYPMKVARQFHGKGEKPYLDIADATQIFRKYSEIHEVNRIHCDLHLLSKKEQERIHDLITA